MYIFQKLNTLSSIVPTPPNEGVKKRKVLGELYSRIVKSDSCTVLSLLYPCVCMSKLIVVRDEMHLVF